MVTLKRTKAIAVIASAIFLARPSVNAQTADTTKSKVDYSVGVDLYSRYLWRGFQNGHAPAFQPTMKVTYKNFVVGAWGSAQFSDIPGGSVPETDLFATYTLPKGFSITINDYFISLDEMSFGKYSDYSDKGLHQIEGYLTWTGPEKFPLSVNVGYSFFGAKYSATAVGNMNGSFYTELDYAIKNLTLIVAGGDKYYTQKTDFNLVNVGIKIVKNVVVTDKFTLPITGQIMYNPNVNHLYYTVGFSF